MRGRKRSANIQARGSLAFRDGLSIQKFTNAPFEGREVIRDAPGNLLAVRGELNPTDQIRSGLKTDADFRSEGFVESILYGRALLRWEERAAIQNALNETFASEVR